MITGLFKPIINSFGANLQNLHIAPVPSNFSIIASKMVTIFDFCAFLGSRLKSTMALKEVNISKFMFILLSYT